VRPASSGPTPYLVVVSGLGAGIIFRLDHDSTIGRDVDADIRLLEIDVSRRHARVRVNGQEIVFEDGGSRNGTTVNNRRVTSRVPWRKAIRSRSGRRPF
jgi:pSer/pThr/pTyr-binding forkhead associated (FHA) protein